MNEHEQHIVDVVTERYERRLSEETGKLRVEMVNGFGALRTEMSDRNFDLLKWMLAFWLAGIAAVAGLLALFQ